MMPHQIIFREFYGANGGEVVYIKPPDQRTVVALHSSYSHSVARSLVSSLKNFFRVVFLPQGYPESVSQDYSSYQFWDTVQAFCSSLSGTLTTQAIMKGVGVGNEAATPIAAAITWILKDGAGNVGRIVFAWWKGTSLDADCKKWRLCADILNDFAMFLELLLPYFMGYSTALLCAATVLKSIVGVAGGATRAALTQHQAIRDNMADVSAKDGSQETCVNLLASVAGIVLLTSVEQLQFIWFFFFVFTLTHLYANYRAVKALKISTFNSARLHIVIKNYIESGSVMNPNTANQKEAVFLGQGLSARDTCGRDVIIGQTVEDLVRSAALTADQLKVLHHLHENRSYMLIPSQKHKTIYVLLQQGFSVNSNDIVRAYFHALILGIALRITIDEGGLYDGCLAQNDQTVLKKLKKILKDTCTKAEEQSSSPTCPALPSSVINAIIASMQLDASESGPFLDHLLKAGWAGSGHHLGSNEWRFLWTQPTKQGVSAS